MQLRAYLENECMPDLHSSGLINVRTGSRVTAVVPVHLYGQMADMDPIVDLARKYNLLVIEDACQAHGAQYFSRRERRWRTAGLDWARGRVQFLSGEESRRLRRGRRRRHQ